MSRFSPIIGFAVAGSSFEGKDRAPVVKRRILEDAVSDLLERGGLSRSASFIRGEDNLIAAIDTGDIISVFRLLLDFGDVLETHINMRPEEHRIKARAVAHLGAWSFHEQTVIGEGINQAASYLDSRPLRQFLWENQERKNFVCGVSEVFHQAIKRSPGMKDIEGLLTPYEFNANKFNGTIYLYASYGSIVNLGKLHFFVHSYAIHEMLEKSAPNKHGILELTPITPIGRGTFVGRERELKTLCEIIAVGELANEGDRINLAYVQGLGGMGKTCLVLEALERSDKSRFKYAIWYSFYNNNSQVAFITRLADFLGLDEKSKSLAETTRELIRFLVEKSVLLALDGIEMVQIDIPNAPGRSAFEEINISAPGEIEEIRSPLQLILERLFWTDSLVIIASRIPPNNDYVALNPKCVKLIVLEQLYIDEARLLFQNRGGVLDKDEFRTLYDMLGGHPLALSLAAGLLSGTDKTANAETLERFLSGSAIARETSVSIGEGLNSNFEVYFKTDDTDPSKKPRFGEKQLALLIYAVLDKENLRKGDITPIAPYFPDFELGNVDLNREIAKQNLIPLKEAGLISLRRDDERIGQIHVHPLIATTFLDYVQKNHETIFRDIAYRLASDSGRPATDAEAYELIDLLIYSNRPQKGWSTLKKLLLENRIPTGKAAAYIEKLYKLSRERKDLFEIETVQEIKDTYYTRILDKRVEGEKLDAWMRISERFAHKIGNQLFAAAGEMKLLEQDTALKNREELQHIRMCLERINAIIFEYRRFNRNEPISLTPTHLGSLVKSVADAFKNANQTVIINVSAESDIPPCLTDAPRIRDVIGELLENAIRHLPDGGIIDVSVSATHEGRFIRIVIADNGPGVQDDRKKMIFEPFSSERPGGSGLGLAIVKSIVENHGGWIDEKGIFKDGARFEIMLPVNLAVED